MNRPEPINDLLHLPLLNGHYWLWQPFMEKYDCQTIAEIGISEGDNFELMIKHKPKLAVAVDPWIDDGIPSHNDSGSSQKELDEMYRNFTKRIKDCSQVQVYRDYSFNTAKLFSNETFDLVYIDGNHTFEGCLKDLEDWYPKVKSGKFLTGDDYWEDIEGTSTTGVKFGVVKAVRKFALDHNLTFYVIPPKGWAIIKPF